MKIIKRILVSIGAFFGVIILAAATIIITGTNFSSYKSPKTPTQNWMSFIDDEVLLNDVVIPGSHDAGTVGLPWFTNTQNYSIKEQLETGTRYFDLRVNFDGEDYKMYHAISNGVLFDPIVDDIASFIVTNPTETLLLDFQHFDNGAQEHVFEKVEQKLFQYAVSNTTEKSDLEFISTLKMKDVRGKVVIFFGYGSHKDSPYIFERNNDDCTKLGCALDSCYYSDENKKSSKDFISESLPMYINDIKRKIQDEKYKGIFVLQGQLTDGLFIFGPWAKEKTHSNNMSDYIRNLPSHPDFNLINVIMRDFINESKATEIFKLNKEKGTVKTNLINDFVSAFN